jgi:hypothetical protein
MIIRANLRVFPLILVTTAGGEPYTPDTRVLDVQHGRTFRRYPT